ncbi:hypothetical protein GCM10023196_035930 [Actinoallomurus vinaceus]|uniref:Uncharacterized protein n=1 Tax=Actinoallomurus vinaceus TaxID=1080074 RepID=A0ABP8U942_9ACTN
MTSAQACRTNALARQAAQAPTEADLCPCGSGSLKNRCPPCLEQQNDPMGALAKGVTRIIERIRAQRTAERDAAYEAWKTAHAPQPEQLEIGA